MRLLDRYLLRELLVPFGYCLGGLLVVLISADLFHDFGRFQKRGLLGREIAEYYLLSIPENLVLLLPIALLLALLYALTSHARNNEITAIRASGVSPWRLSVPYFLVGLLAAGVLFACNEFWVPQATDAAEALLNRHQARKLTDLPRGVVRNLGFTNVRGGRTWQAITYNLETSEMLKPEVHWTLPDGDCIRIDAQRAICTNGVWTFYEVAQYKETTQTNSMPLPLLQAKVLPLPQFTETPEQIRSHLRISWNLRFNLGKGTKTADVPIFEILNYLRLNPNPMPADQRWLFTKLHGRLATPWTCLVVVLIAIPFGAASGRRNVYVGVASSIVIFFAYFVLQQMALTAGTIGWLPPWVAAWIPNWFFGLLGLVLTVRLR